ncbi:alkane 1-monooxygenase [Xinfangfangia sp. CPCC 101601]|uniref:Alkane 1-monooxygenase n=1 Tax=Pseudogemmobacter lacusdianii TaxID=3069608 RepID=A0ABU0VXA5_9RHOB|nr:alkane 1-monooxygenase [Xinfangfangia sp. CPCC 101601]MDQ2066395.1 alkane 1-monooxygenase [Xinfangfangia sp. CPCC 101601]
MSDTSNIASPLRALPYFLSLGTVPLAFLAMGFGGLWVLAMPLYCWTLFSLLDAVTGLNQNNPATDTPEDDLFLYQLLTLIWFPLQLFTLCFMLWFVPQDGQLNLLEKVFLFIGMGVMSGTIGINYSHELMHQKSKLERWLADLLLASVLYSHFRSEHLKVHHLYVGTPRDAVTARYNENFHRFFLRVLPESLFSAFRAEKAWLARKSKPWFHPSNPFWRYWALQGAMLLLAYALGGWMGLLFFLIQAFTAIWQLELTNYVEHYGLTRRHLGDGKYEHALPRHSWNAPHRATNWLLINLQRHSDHHYKPDRRFPLLQTYPEDEAPQLPFGYPLMNAMALIPPLWLRRMNPRVRAWRRQHYPDITDWSDYNAGRNPMPVGAP